MFSCTGFGKLSVSRSILAVNYHLCLFCKVDVGVPWEYAGSIYF